MQLSHWRSLQSKNRVRGNFGKFPQKCLCWINYICAGKVQNSNFTVNVTKFSKTAMLQQSFTVHCLRGYVNPGPINHLTGTSKVNNVLLFTTALLRTLSCCSHDALRYTSYNFWGPAATQQKEDNSEFQLTPYHTEIRASTYRMDVLKHPSLHYSIHLRAFSYRIKAGDYGVWPSQSRSSAHIQCWSMDKTVVIWSLG